MPSLHLSLAEVAELLTGDLVCQDESVLVHGVQTLEKATGKQAGFLANMKYKTELEHTKAALVLVSPKIKLPDDYSFAVLRLADPYTGFAKLQRYFHPNPISTGFIHASAVVDDSAQLAKDVQIDANVCVAAGVSIGEGSIIGAGSVLEEGVQVGENCLLHSRVTLAKGTVLGHRVIIQSGAVLGSDGFGFAWTGAEFLKIPQVGHVIIEDDVEIGANTCIDRGAIDNTVIQKGVKLDNLIQIGHNVEIGTNTVMAGQVGVSGSTIIGKGCQLGGQSGLAGHLNITDGVIVGAKAGVIGDIKEPGMVSGFPAVPHRKWLRSSGIFDRLPEVWNKIKRLG